MNSSISAISPQLQNAAVLTTDITDKIALAKRLLTEGKTVNYVASTTGLPEVKILEMQISIVPLL